VFDVKAVRRALEARVKALDAENSRCAGLGGPDARQLAGCQLVQRLTTTRPTAAQVERLQQMFSLIHSTLAQQATLQAAPAVVKQSDLTERPHGA
jgi:hypothetical protein